MLEYNNGDVTENNESDERVGCPIFSFILSLPLNFCIHGANRESSCGSVDCSLEREEQEKKDSRVRGDELVT